ncbi:kinase-like protein [Melanogaster broomeanus]|nr:kinase-like protein [Melanogaster broomeanus]
MLRRELSVWARLENENILLFYGVALGFGPLPALVCPWAVNGTLNQYLMDHVDLNLLDRLKLVCDMASGLHYLHSRNVIHGDLTGTNVLINAAGRALLSDFGLSTIHQEFLGTSYFTTSSRGNMRWAAPELFDLASDGSPKAIINEKTDIYSFGSVTLQALSGQMPFPTSNTHQVIIKVSQGERPPRVACWDGTAISDDLWAFIVKCWDDVQLRRPSSAEVHDFIRRKTSDLL